MFTNSSALNLDYYSNFDKHHYKDFHRSQCTEPTLLAFDNFLRFSSNSTKCSVIIEYAVDYWFLCLANHSLDGPMDACWSESAKYCVLQNNAQFSYAELTISDNP